MKLPAWSKLCREFYYAFAADVDVFCVVSPPLPDVVETYIAENTPSAMIIIAWQLHITMLNAVPSVLDMPKSERANMMARFQGPRPPLEGIAIDIDPNTNTTSPGISPYAMWGSVMSLCVNGNAKNTTYV